MSDRLGEILRAQLAQTLEHTDDIAAGALGHKTSGKVRDSYVTGDRRAMIATDRLSAFDVVVGTIPFKGQVLNQLAAYWLEETRGVAPNHLLAVPDPNVSVVRECAPLRAEFVVRSYLTGVTNTAIWRAYEGGARTFCGHRLPEGMRKNQRLPQPILTPSTKAPRGEHDISVSRAELIEMGAITAERFDRAAEIAMALFEFGQRRAAERGLILVDTKYEMGIALEGEGGGEGGEGGEGAKGGEGGEGAEIVVIDEVHTPDSSRYWYADDYERRMAEGLEPRSLDKEYVRRWLVEEAGWRGDGAAPTLPDDVRIEAARRYIATYELVTGRPFVPDTTAPARRIARNLAAYGLLASGAGA